MPPRGSSTAKTKTAKPHFCRECGKSGPFRKDTSLQCIECDEKSNEKRREYGTAYHRTRNRVVRRLIDRHKDEYEEMMKEERAKEKSR